MIPLPLADEWTPTSHELKTAKLYSVGTDSYHEVRAGSLNFGLWTRPRISYEVAARDLVLYAVRDLEFNSSSVILDAGCGMGAGALWVFEQYPFISSIVGLDVTPVHVKRARERARRHNIPKEKVEFFYGSGTEIPFTNGTFTHIYSIEAPQHMDTRLDFFKEAFRVLQLKGRLAFTDYSLVRPPKNFFERAVVSAAAKLWCVPKENIYGNEEFKRKLQNIGFTDVLIENRGKDVIPGYFFVHLKWSSIKETAKIRGFWLGVVTGFFVDLAVYMAYRTGLCEYIFVTAKKDAV